jgi:predicted double-glycine peptidase
MESPGLPKCRLEEYNGHIEMLRWERAHGWDWIVQTCAKAAEEEASKEVHRNTKYLRFFTKIVLYYYKKCIFKVSWYPQNAFDTTG